MKTLIKAFVAVIMLAVILPAQAVEYTRVTYVHTDADGTPFAATDEQGNLEWQIEHMPFGAEHRNTQVRRESNLSFVGRMYDEEIGLSYFGGRWYDPHAGRFTGIDPMPVNPEDWRTFNRYAYGNNNPYKYVDPDGNLPILIPIVMFLVKEGLAEVASRQTGGATDFLSVRRMSSKAVKKSIQLLKRNKSGSSKQVDIQLKYKQGWTDAQKAAADAKCKALCEADTVVTKSKRSGTSASSRYKSAGNSVESGNDVDHVVDLQLGGADNVSNMLPLNSSVNRSLGSQIHHKIKKLPVGTVINKVKIK